jgi:hypothetical protein
VILGNIRARAHFLVLLTPSVLERCAEPGDWLRREIETALDTKRNIVPLTLEGFDFSTPGIAQQLTGSLSRLSRYNALQVPADYFDEAMARLRTRYLNVALDVVLHPASAVAAEGARLQQVAAAEAPAVTKEELTAQEWYLRGLKATDDDEELNCYTEALRLKPDFEDALVSRASVRYVKGDVDGAIEDLKRAGQWNPAEIVRDVRTRTVSDRAAELISLFDQINRLRAKT